MYATELIGNNIKIELKDVEKTNTKCSICGRDVQEAIQSKKILSAKFTNYEYLKYKSDYICKKCAICIKDDRLRKNNFVADKKNIFFFKQIDTEKYIFNLKQYVELPFVIAITKSFKKHNSFKCVLNYDYSNFCIQEEEKKYQFDIKEMSELYSILNKAYMNFTKDELLTGNYNIYSIENYGINQFNKLETILKKYRKTHQYELLIYMLNSEKRNQILKEKKRRKKDGKIKRN